MFVGAEQCIYRFDQIETQLTGAKTGRCDLFLDTSFNSLITDRLDTMLRQTGILSLDVFDTLILRDNSSEITRFYDIGGKMAALANASTGRGVSQVDAFVARHLGTKASYRASRMINGCREGSLSEIHATASCLLTRDDKLAEAFITAELEYEAGRIEKNAFLVEYAERHRARGGRVVLLTDMYMHAEQVARLLNALGIPETAYDALISSADTKVSKASGGVFRTVQEQMQASPSDFVHVGDNFRGDFAQAVRQGWQALHLPLALFDIRERQRDHSETANMLNSQFGIVVDIAMPK